MLTVTGDQATAIPPRSLTQREAGRRLAATMRDVTRKLDEIWNGLDAESLGAEAYAALEDHPYHELFMREAGTIALCLQTLAAKLDG